MIQLLRFLFISFLFFSMYVYFFNFVYLSEHTRGVRILNASMSNHSTENLFDCEYFLFVFLLYFGFILHGLNNAFFSVIFLFLSDPAINLLTSLK